MILECILFFWLLPYIAYWLIPYISTYLSLVESNTSENHYTIKDLCNETHRSYFSDDIWTDGSLLLIIPILNWGLIIWLIGLEFKDVDIFEKYVMNPIRFIHSIVKNFFKLLKYLLCPIRYFSSVTKQCFRFIAKYIANIRII